MQRLEATKRRRNKPPRGPGRPAGRSLADGVIADAEVLLAAAERLIREQGPAVSLDAIAKAAGVTKPVLYRGVGDRDALANALALRLNARMTEFVGKRTAKARSAEDAVRQLVAGYLECAANDQHIYLYVTAGSSSDDSGSRSLRLADATVQQFAQGISAYRKDRGAASEVATTWAYALVGALHYVTLWLLRERAIDLDSATNHVTALLWSGVGLDIGEPLQLRNVRKKG